MHTNSTHATPLLTALEQVTPRDHLCSIYDSVEEQFAVAVPFIRVGLERGEKCIYIAESGTESVVQDAMQAEGIDVERAVATGSLVLANKEAAYLKRGSFDPAWMLTFWADATAEAMSQGFSALRATGETEWALRGARGTERWLEYESRLTHTLAGQNCTALCQYNRQLFTPELILDVIRTHPTVIYRGVVCRNMYHVPPDEFLATNPAREVERLLSNILEREEIEYALRQQRDELARSERLLRLVLDALPVGVSVMDASGNITLSNPASQRIWSGSRPSGRQRYAESKAWWHTTGKRLVPSEWASVRAFVNGETRVNEVLDIEDFNGVRKVIQNSAVPIRDANERITGAVVVNEDISDRTRAEREVNDSYDQMRTLTGRLMHAQDGERRRIAQILHETTAQDLAGLKMLLARLKRTAADRLDDSERSALTESISLAEQSMAQTRTLSSLLHPPFLDEAGLSSALRWFAAGFAERSGIKVEVDVPGDFERLALDIETTLFRIVQESLINIYRHAGSRTARIRLRHDAEVLVLEVVDCGRGIPKASLKRIRRGAGGGVGIAGISERIEQLGGRLEITSSNHGTTVRVRLPLAKTGE